MDRVATEVKLAQANTALTAAKTAYPLVVQDIAKAKADVDKYTKGIELIDEIAKELHLTDKDIESLDTDLSFFKTNHR